MKLITALLLVFSNEAFSRNACRLYTRQLRYYKIKECVRSYLPSISRSNVESLDDCMDFARKKQGLAFNFSPAEAAKFYSGYLKNCEVLGCPEIGNSSTLVEDFAFDYYSAYDIGKYCKYNT